MSSASDSGSLTGWICGLAPEGWRDSSSVEVVSADGVVQIVAFLDRIEEGTDLDTYAAAQDAALFEVVPASACTDAAITPLISGLPTSARIAAWKHEDGTDVSTLVLTAVHQTWGVRCSASAPRTSFADRLPELVDVVAHLTFPFTATVASAVADDAPDDDVQS